MVLLSNSKKVAVVTGAAINQNIRRHNISNSSNSILFFFKEFVKISQLHLHVPMCMLEIVM